MENGAGDLISRERLKKMIKATRKGTESFASQAYRTGYVAALSTLEGVIADEPAVDAAPVVHGEWNLKHVGFGHYWECSVCHTNPCIYVTKDTKFCPNCGAKMDGENG